MKIIACLAAAAAMALSACATVTQGSTDTVQVLTDPGGASCDLTREGALIGRAQPTPALIAVSKSRKDILLSCELDGHLPATGLLSSEFEGATLGNVLLGGVIGVGVDAASGALNDYPPVVEVKMTPKAFDDEEGRDAFFRQRLSDLETTRETVVAEIEQECSASEDECERRLKAAGDAFDKAVTQLETDYRNVRPQPAGPLPAPSS